MAVGKSVAEELLNALKMPKLHPMPSYISEADTVSVDDFMQSRYAHDYVLDTSNIHWGGELNSNHVFDIYAGYHLSRDINKVQLEMLEYVTVNSERYAWDCHSLLCMSRLSLSNWRAKMTFWANPADTMAIYSLSDQFGLHMKMYLYGCENDNRCENYILIRDPSITTGILRSLKWQKQLYKEMLLSKTDVSTFRYRSYRNCLQKIIRSNRRYYLHDKCKEYRQNGRKLWQLINRIIGRENNKHNTIVESR